MKDLQNWWTLSTIQIGGVICLPVIMIGQTLSQHYGFMAAVISILIGNAILLLLGLVTVKMSHSNRKTTMENAGDYFGEKGASFFALAMIISLVGWFGIQLNMMSLGVLDLLSVKEARESWLLILNLGLGGLITYVALNGIKNIGILANVSLPFLLLTLGYAIYTVDPKYAVLNESPTFSIGGTSLVIALAIAFVVDLPTYYRFAKSAKDGLISISLIFVLVLPLLEIIGVYLTTGNADGNILEVLKRENAVLWNSWIALFLILAGWTTNNLNLYSAAICLQSIFKEMSEKKATLWIGLAGTFLSCYDLLNHLELVLDVVGIFIASMGSVVITRYLFLEYYGLQLSSRSYSSCMAAWTLGIAVGFISILGYTFTYIALLDAVLGASIGTMLTLTCKETYEKA
jgi:purine-cytosine permease-like protein